MINQNELICCWNCLKPLKKENAILKQNDNITKEDEDSIIFKYKYFCSEICVNMFENEKNKKNNIENNFDENENEIINNDNSNNIDIDNNTNDNNDNNNNEGEDYFEGDDYDPMEDF